MPGVWVFAGGIVDPGDYDSAERRPPQVDLEEWAHRVCGARELGEEASVPLEPVELVPWSRWITPEPVPARFDTRFYVALAPPHSAPRPDGVEMDEARWIGASAALDAGRRGELELSFPTVRHLEDLTGFAAAEEVIAAAAERTVEPILPRVVGDESSWSVLLPGDPGYED